MKFGGSLLASSRGIRRVGDLVERTRREGHEIVVVVSALGDVTDVLLHAANEARGWNQREILEAIDELRRIHRAAIEQSSMRGDRKTEVLQGVEVSLEKLRETLLGISMLKELSPRSRDLVVSFGERMSAPIVSAEVRSRGMESSSLTGGEAGIVTDDTFGEAAPIQGVTIRSVRKRLLPMLRGGGVPVVTGFVARSKSGETTTLGRGGSDYTATLIASSIDADEVWIWTDVSGILTADPRVVKEAATVRQLSYAEAEELAFFGAKNMHPLALGPARTGGIPVRIKNGFRPELPGTLITKEQTKSRGVVKAVAVVRNVGLLTVAGETLQGKPGVAARVFSALASNRVNVLMISQSVSEANISIIVKRSSLKLAQRALSRELKNQGIAVEGDPAVSVVAAVGAGMRGERGVAAKIFGAVAARGINVRMIAQGSSELNVSFVIDERNADDTARAVHSLVVKQYRGKRE
jgi:aspartate kinase